MAIKMILMTHPHVKTDAPKRTSLEAFNLVWRKKGWVEYKEPAAQASTTSEASADPKAVK